MSCDNASAPLNLIKDINLLQKCSVVCEYKANYPACRGSALNKGDHISIKLDQCAVDVTYNREKFALFEIRVYQPSLHAWEDKKASGEIIIIHKKKTIDKTKPEMLLVCIPIQVGNIDSNGWLDFIPIIPNYNVGDNREVSINIPQWTLNSIVPKGNYYNYQGTSPFAPCSDRVEMVVYSLDQAVICSQRYLNHLKASLPQEFQVQPRTYTSSRLHKLYYHQEGSLGENGEGEVYLDCQDVAGDSPEDSNFDNVAEPTNIIYRGMESGEKVSTTTVPWEPIIITGCSLITLIIIIKAWNFYKNKKN